MRREAEVDLEVRVAERLEVARPQVQRLLRREREELVATNALEDREQAFENLLGCKAGGGVYRGRPKELFYRPTKFLYTCAKKMSLFLSVQLGHRRYEETNI